MSVTVLDLPRQQHAARTSFKVELFAGNNFAACDWPSIADERDLQMYIFQSREFLELWTSTIGKANSIEAFLLVVRNSSGEPVLYLPLAIETKFNVRILHFMDCGVADYNAPILKAGLSLSRGEFKSLWERALTLLPGFDVVDLTKIAGDVSGAVNPLTNLDCTPHRESGHSLLIKGNGTAAGNASVGLRRKLDREYRKISERGAVEFVVNPAGDLAGAVTEKLFALKRQKYKQTNIPDFLAFPGVADFYRAVVSEKWIGKIGHLSALLIDNAVVSAHLGYIGRGSFYYIFPAYDESFGRYRPGHLLLRELIDRSAQQENETFDFGIGDEAYKAAWADHHLPLYDHEYAITTAGRVYLQMRRIRRFVKSSGIRSWFRRTG
jgi:CelD/BcsL family acetyltransferase involved in cellulose biosynthesis